MDILEQFQAHQAGSDKDYNDRDDETGASELPSRLVVESVSEAFKNTAQHNSTILHSTTRDGMQSFLLSFQGKDCLLHRKRT